MAERKSWSDQEDRILKDLRQVRLISKWSQIAQIMKSQFQIFGRNGKQCRERYHNHLDSKICKQKWKNQEEQQLLALHSEMGNRWAAISRQLPGRTDNCVKNHFYSYFRKCIKNVNYSLSIVSERKLRPLKLSIMNKIISFIEAYHHDPHNFDKNAYEDARDVKDRIFQFADISAVTQQNCRTMLSGLAEKLTDLNKTSRKKYVKKRKVKVVLDQSEQVHFKSKDLQYGQQQLLEEDHQTIKTIKNHPSQFKPPKLGFQACISEPIPQEPKQILTGQKKRQEQKQRENLNIMANFMYSNEKQTPMKQKRQEDKNSSYSKLYSLDYLDLNPVDMPEQILIYDDIEQKFQFND